MTGAVSALGMRATVAAVFAGALALFGGSGQAAADDYSFKASYRVSLNGLGVGSAHLLGKFDGSGYRLDGQGRLNGIVGLLFDYTATAASAGRIGARWPAPNAFSVDATDGKRSASVRMTLAGDRVRDIVITPPPRADHPDRVSVTSAHKRNVVDPMSALIAPGGFAGGRFDRSVCDRVVPVFNGRERFDVKLEYKGIETVSGRSGYSGEVMTCTARYRPVAGHRADRRDVEYLADRMVVDLMLAPVDGTEMLVPYRASMRTPLGVCVVEATDIAAKGALPARAAALDPAR